MDISKTPERPWPPTKKWLNAQPQEFAGCSNWDVYKMELGPGSWFNENFDGGTEPIPDDSADYDDNESKSSSNVAKPKIRRSKMRLPTYGLGSKKLTHVNEDELRSCNTKQELWEMIGAEHSSQYNFLDDLGEILETIELSTQNQIWVYLIMNTTNNYAHKTQIMNNKSYERRLENRLERLLGKAKEACIESHMIPYRINLVEDGYQTQLDKVIQMVELLAGFDISKQSHFKQTGLDNRVESRKTALANGDEPDKDCIIIAKIKQGESETYVKVVRWLLESITIAQTEAGIPQILTSHYQSLEHYDPENTKRRSYQRTSGPVGEEFNKKYPECLNFIDHIAKMTNTIRSNLTSARNNEFKFALYHEEKQRVRVQFNNTLRQNSYAVEKENPAIEKYLNQDFNHKKETSSSSSSSSKSNKKETPTSTPWPEKGSSLKSTLLTEIKTTEESPENFSFLEGVLAGLYIDSVENDEISKLLESIGVDRMDIKTTSGLSNVLYEYEKRRRRGPNYARRPESANKKYGHTAHIDSLNNSNMNLLVIASFQGKCRALEVSSCHNCFKEKDFHLEEILAENGIFLVWFRQDFNDRRQHAVSGDGDGPRLSSSHRLSHKDGKVPTFKEWTKTIQNCKDDFEWIQMF